MPICWVQALHLMRTSTLSEDRKIFSVINGILFFGVPNQGMDISSLIPMVANQANRGFLHTLESNSPILRMQAQQYSDAIVNLRCDVVNFYETKKSYTAQQSVSCLEYVVIRGDVGGKRWETCFPFGGFIL